MKVRIFRERPAAIMRLSDNPADVAGFFQQKIHPPGQAAIIFLLCKADEMPHDLVDDDCGQWRIHRVFVRQDQPDGQRLLPVQLVDVQIIVGNKAAQHIAAQKTGQTLQHCGADAAARIRGSADIAVKLTAHDGIFRQMMHQVLQIGVPAKTVLPWPE